MPYLREVNEANGDLVDLIWYCSEGCMNTDKDWQGLEGYERDDPEHDYPDFCANCGDAIGNALTPEGESYLIEMVRAPRGLTTDQMESLYQKYANVIDKVA